MENSNLQLKVLKEIITDSIVLFILGNESVFLKQNTKNESLSITHNFIIDVFQ